MTRPGRPWKLALGLVALAPLLPGIVQADGDARWHQFVAREQARCEAIPADRYWTALIFNPDDLETGFERSRCFQDLAIRLRDRQWCRQARERRSWLFDGSGISPGACRSRVLQRIRQDAAAARQLRGPQQVTGLQLWRNGNGRDIDVHVRTSGGAGTGLWLTISVVGDDGHERIVYSRPQSMNDRATELVHFIALEDMRRALGSHPPDRALTLRATLQRLLDDPDDRAIHRHAPHIALLSKVQTRVALSDLQRAPLSRAP